QVAASALLPALAMLEAEGVALILREDDGDTPTLTVRGAAGQQSQIVQRWRRLPLDAGTPAGYAVLSGAPVYVGSTAEARQRFPAMFRVPSTLTQQAWAAVPLRAGGVVIGALGVGFGQGRDFPPAERRFLETVADQCALAVERARLYSTAATERERLAAVLDRLPAGVVIGEAPTGRLVLGNAEVERIWGQPFQAGIGFDQYGTYRGFHPDGRPYEDDEWPLSRSLTRGEVVTGEEVDVERLDGTRGTIVVNSAPIHDADGTVTAAVCTFVDITDRAEARRRLDAAYEAERKARAAAEAASERLGRLQQITAGLAEALTVEQVAAVMVRGGLSVAGCRSAWIGVLDETGEALGVLAASFPVGPGGAHPAQRRLATGRGHPHRPTGLAVLGRGRAGPLPGVEGDRHRRRCARRRPAGLARQADRRDDAQLRRRGHVRRPRTGADHDAGRAVRAGAGAGPAAGALARRRAGAAAEHAAQRAARGRRAGADGPLPPGGRVARGGRRLVRRGRAARRPGRARGRGRGRPRPAGGDHDGTAAQRAGRAGAVHRVAGAGPGRARAVRGTGRGRPAGHGRVRGARPDRRHLPVRLRRPPAAVGAPSRRRHRAARGGPVAAAVRAAGRYDRPAPGGDLPARARRPAAALLRRPGRAAPGVADRGPAPAGRGRGGGGGRARLVGRARPADDGRRRGRRRGAARG